MQFSRWRSSTNPHVAACVFVKLPAAKVDNACAACQCGGVGKGCKGARTRDVGHFDKVGTVPSANRRLTLDDSHARCGANAAQHDALGAGAFVDDDVSLGLRRSRDVAGYCATCRP